MKLRLLLLAIIVCMQVSAQDIQIVGNPYDKWRLGADSSNQLFLLNHKNTLVMPLDSIQLEPQLINDVIKADTTLQEEDVQLFLRIMETFSGPDSQPGTALKIFGGLPNTTAILLRICDADLTRRYSAREIKKMKRR